MLTLKNIRRFFKWPHAVNVALPATLASSLDEGWALLREGQLEHANAIARHIVEDNPSNTGALYLSGLCEYGMGNAANALEMTSRLISGGIADAGFYNLHGQALAALARVDEAVAAFDAGISLNPQLASAYHHRGLALHRLGQPLSAVSSYTRAIELSPDDASMHLNRGISWIALRDYDNAQHDFTRAIDLQPQHHGAWHALGVLQFQRNQPAAAVTSSDRAIELMPAHGDAYQNKASALFQLRRYADALGSLQRALELQPDNRELFGQIVYTKLRLCDWEGFEEQVDEVVSRTRQGEVVLHPFAFLAITDSPNLHLQAARNYFQQCLSPSLEISFQPQPLHEKKIRIGYFSGDYYNHPTTCLIAELFELHDREKFELIAFSFGPEYQDVMRERVVAAFDQFHDVFHLSSDEIVRKARELEIDIAVDLKGYTQDARPTIFISQVAPIQVSYLGYPGTLGFDRMHYLIADATVIPAGAEKHYVEQIVYLPDSYQVNDARRHVDEHIFSRHELGLPEKGVVYCCFNNSHKINPKTFTIWMRVLKAVDGSVLWLLADDPTIIDNLRREASIRGVDPDRLVFANRLPLELHLSRHRAADLLLDTLPYNAHTTASDALWVGLPVLTCCGQGFCGRVAASLLNAIGLPELVTETSESYEALAIELGREPKLLNGFRQKLAKNRLTTPLFNSQRFTRNLEWAYLEMMRRHRTKQPIAAIRVP